MANSPSMINTHRILIAVEDSKYTEKTIRYGYDLAKILGAQVALIHVVDPPTANTYGAIDPIMGTTPVYVPEINDVQEDISRQLLDRLAAQWNGNPADISLIHKIGQPKTEILATAAEWQADLIVLGTHGRTGFDHFISGSVSEGVARRSVCPVLIVPYKDPEESSSEE